MENCFFKDLKNIALICSLEEKKTIFLNIVKQKKMGYVSYFFVSLVQYKVYSVQYALYGVYCMVHIVQCIIFIYHRHFIPCNVFFSLHCSVIQYTAQWYDALALLLYKEHWSLIGCTDFISCTLLYE